MAVAGYHRRPWGYQWRSSRTFIVATVSVALFGETFLYGFLVPILSYMLETRLHRDPSQTQTVSAALLSSNGLLALVSAPVIAHFADKTSHRKIPLLMSLIVCIIGTTLTAAAPGLALLFLGRVLQGLSSSAAWIVCFATISHNIDPAHMGKAMGVAMSFVTCGVMTGPMVAGTMLEAVGYWPTWSIPLVVLVLNLIARLAMLENGDVSTVCSDSAEAPVPSSSSASSETTVRDEETSALLSSTFRSYESTASDPITEGTERAEISSRGFYNIMLRDTRVMIGIVNTVVYPAIIAGFNATLPLHLYRVFHWGTRPVGMIFLALQVPTIVLGPAVGVLRDRTGLRTPTAVGWLLMAPLLWLLGSIGRSRTYSTAWINLDGNGKAVLIACIVGIGIVSTVLRSVGSLQMTAVVHEMQTENPRIFGKHGGHSRVFSIVEVSFNLGLVAGPLLSSLLSETVGYYFMNVILAVTSLVMAVLSFYCFDSNRPAKQH